MRKLGRAKVSLSLIWPTVVVLIIVSLIPPVAVPVSANESSFIKFENFEAGAIVESVSSGNGITGREVDGYILVDGYHPELPGNQAMIFDATCGGDASQCSGDEADLYQPTLGNVLVVSDDGNPENPKPAEITTASLKFDFSNWGSGKVTVNSIDVLDIEGNDAKVELYSGGEAGTLLAVIPIPETGNNGLATVFVNVSGIDFMRVTPGGPGAIDNVQITAEEDLGKDDLADVAVVKKASAEQVLVGEEFNYTIFVKNLGPGVAQGVVLTDSLPEEVEFVSVAPTEYCSFDGAVNCYWPEINNGDIKEIRIVVKTTTVGSVTNTATVTADTEDPNPEKNNSDSVDIVINPAPIAEADVAVTKVASAEEVIVGEVFSYTITVENLSDSVVAEDVGLVDYLPEPVEFLSVSSTEYCSLDGAIYCYWPEIGVGASEIVQIQVVAGEVGIATNTVNISSETDDPNLDNNSDSVDVNIILRPEADLTVSKTEAVDPVSVGAVISYTVTVTNTGPDTAENVVLTDYLPEDTSFVSATSEVDAVECGESENVVTCNLGQLFSGQAVDIDIAVTALAGGEVFNNVSVTSDTFDPNDENNWSGEDTLVTQTEADLSLAKVVNYDTPASGAPITFTLTISNAGPAEATNVQVNDQLPPEFTFGASTASQGSYDDTTGLWTVGSLPGGFTATLDIMVTVPDQGVLTNTAEVVASDQPDSDSTPANNNPAEDDQASVSILVEECNNIIWPFAAGPDDCVEAQLFAQTFGKSSSGLAEPLQQEVPVLERVFEQTINQRGQDRWYRFPVSPQSIVFVTLTNLSVNYDITLYTDIYQAFMDYQDLDSAIDLLEYGAEVAPSALSPSALSPSALSPSALSPSALSDIAFSPDALSAAAFSPSALSPSALSADNFSPSALSPSALSPVGLSPSALSPSALSPSALSPSALSPSALSPSALSPSALSPSALSDLETIQQAYTGAQIRSLIGVSAFDGLSSEGLIAPTWNNTGDFYVRVRGRNGVSDKENPFQLMIKVFGNVCNDVAPSSEVSNLAAAAYDGDFETIILTDLGRMEGTPEEKEELWTRLNTFAGRPEINGIVLNVGDTSDRHNSSVNLDFLPAGDNKVIALNNQADGNSTCPYAKNLVADSIKDIIDRYWELNPLEYVVIVGDDDDIPFFRHPDQAMLGNETNYDPPVWPFSHSKASLKLGYVLSQDRYGSKIDVAARDEELPYPGLAVGRLVESVQDVLGMIDAYQLTSNGVVDTPTSSFVGGYDFLADAADAIQSELEAGLGAGAVTDQLIAPNDLAPELGWTAEDLSSYILNNRYDLIFLAGHFCAQCALAADFETSLLTTDLLQPGVVDMTNAIIYSAGCHSGYNIVNEHDTPITFEPDWAQTFARKGATLIAGTGYQYGDTDFIEYSEQLYLDFTKQLRTGSGEVAVGKALVEAKQDYLGNMASDRGIYKKAFLEATLFGWPMLKVNMPGDRILISDESSNVHNITPASSDPGQTLGLVTADLNVSPSLSVETIGLDSLDDESTIPATYLKGSDGVVVNPAEPVLPLEVENVEIDLPGRPNLVLRDVGFRGGTFNEMQDVFALTGAPATEIRGVHPPFFSNFFFPIEPMFVNYWSALGGRNTNLMVTPVQYKSNRSNPLYGTLRVFNQMDLRLYYSDNLSDAAAASGPPSIVRVQSTIDDSGNVRFRAGVVGSPLAGIQEVWITYLDTGGSNEWKSINLVQSNTDSRVWASSDAGSTLPAAAISDPCNVRFMVQAVNGVGLVSMDTNFGTYYKVCPATPTIATTLSLELPSSEGPYGSRITASAELGGVQPDDLEGQIIIFNFGSQSRLAVTDGNGQATVTIPLLGLPETYVVRAGFFGTDDYLPSFDTAEFTITKAATVLCLEHPADARDDDCTPLAELVVGQASDRVLMVARLADENGLPLDERRTIFFRITRVSDGSGRTIPVVSDSAGRAVLGNLNLPPGDYKVQAFFLGDIPVSDGGVTITLNDARYDPSVSTEGDLTVTAPIADTGRYAVFGLKSVWLRLQSAVHTGNVGANSESDQWLYRRNEVAVGRYATVGDEDPNSFIAGDTILLDRGATVNHLFYNEIHQGRDVIINGDETSPVDLPLVEANLPNSEITPGTVDVVVQKGETVRLEPGRYNNIIVSNGGILILTGRLYHLNNLYIGKDVRVLSTRQNTRVNIASRLKSARNVTIGPVPGTSLTARDLIIYVTGQDGDDGYVWSNPKAAFIGPSNEIVANIYAPNGTVWLRMNTTARGAFVGLFVRVGRNVDVWLESAFGNRGL